MDLRAFLFQIFLTTTIYIYLVGCSNFHDQSNNIEDKYDISPPRFYGINITVHEESGAKNKADISFDIYGISKETKYLWQSCFKDDPPFFTRARPCAGTRLCRCYNDKACCINITNTVPKLHDKIRLLSCKNCFKQHLTEEAFVNISTLNLTTLDLSRSFLQKIDSVAFSKLKNLKYLKNLDFSTNAFTGIPKLCHRLNNFSGLKWLNFHKNVIFLMNKGTFDCFANLTHLNLGKNHITHFNINKFVKLRKLEVLDLHSNWISSHNVTVIHGDVEMQSLKELNLSKNELGIWPPSLCNGSVGPFPNLENLNLAENLITLPWNSSWSCLKNLKLLNLTRNPIRFLLDNTFSELDSLESLLLNDIFFSIEVFKETALNNSKLWMLTLSNNKIDFKSRENFHHIFKHSSNLTELHLSGNDFKGIDAKIHSIVRPLSKTLQRLHLNNCNLTTIPSRLTSVLPKLRVLKLKHNQIQNFTSDDFKKANKLENISLADNKIQKFDQKSLAGIVTKNLKNLDLSDNPLECTCDEKNENNMRKDIIQVGKDAYIGQAKLTKWPIGYTCGSPSSRVGMLFKDFDIDDMCPETNWLMIILLSFGGFLFFMTVITVIVYKYIWYIRYWIYKVKKRLRLVRSTDPERQRLLENTEHISADVYIINHGNEDLFVLTDIRSVIEQQMGYSSKIYHRDCVLGDKLTLMVDAIYECKHSIAVVSKSFIIDPWCQFQLHVAFDRRVEDKSRNLMLIIYDDIDYQALSNTWCVVLTKTPTAKWCSKGCENYDLLNKLFRQEIEKQLGAPGNRG